MDLLTRADLESLAETVPQQAQVSLFLPTHRYGHEVEADQLRWKNLVAGVESALEGQLRRPDVASLLAPARELQHATMDWQHLSDGLVMFLREGWHRTFRIPAPVPGFAAVGDHLVMGPLLRLLSGDEHFFVLAVSQRSIRLLEGTRNTVEEVQLDEVPTDLRDVVPAQEPRSDTMARPASVAGRGGPAVFYGYGAGDRHLRNREVARFLGEVANGLREVLAAQSSPMVLVGLDDMVAGYRAVSSYGHVMDEAVVRNPDPLSAEELHELAWPLVESRLRAERAEVIDRFRALHGTGRVSSDLGKVTEAAREGRVETLFVQADPWCWERMTGSAPVVRLGVDEQFADCEQVDAAAVATLNANGRIFATSQSVVPDSEVAAIFRY